MAKDDYFKLVYAILTELYESKKSGTKVPPDAIHPERFGIPVSYWLAVSYTHLTLPTNSLV